MANGEMSLAGRMRPLLRWPASAFRDLGASERNLWRAAALVTGLILGFQTVRLAERFLFDTPEGQCLVQNSAEAATRFCTIPHVIVGFLFMASSVRNRTLHKRMWIAGLLLAGAGLCCVYEELLDFNAKLLASAFLYCYFLLHELRDELWFYRILDGARKVEDEQHFRSFARAQLALLLVGVVFILWFSGTLRTPPIFALPGGSTAGLVGIAIVFAAVWLAAVTASYKWYALRRGSTTLQVVSDHRRLIRLLTTIFALTVVGALLTNRLYPIILLHVSVWYVFTCRSLKKRNPAPAADGPWSWMRGTLSGFRTLHIGLSAVCILLSAMAVYTSGPADQIWWLISPDAFPYWTIMHISVSFVPR